MNTTVNNDRTIIQDPTQDVADFIESTLVYLDKSKQYQLKRMARNIWQRSTPLYTKLQKEVNGQLFEKLADGSYSISSCFINAIETEFPGFAYTDKRKDTGKTVALPWVTKPHNMRDYQQEACDIMLKSHRGVINFATGLGKTLVATHLAKQCRKRALIVCPSESVASQFYEIFVSAFGKQKVGFYGDGKKKLGELTIGIAASVSKHIADFQNHELGLVIIDETHHTPATTFFTIAEGLAGVGKVFGLTATDYRSDGKDIMITGGCGHVLMRRDIKWGVDNQWLAELYFIVREVQTGGRDYKDDKLKSYKEHVLNNQIMKDQILADCQKMMASGKTILCLVDEVAHGKELSAALGIPFATGQDSKSQEYVDQLNAGKIKGLIGTDSKVGEGTDTRNVDVLIMANFVASKGPVIQAIGRGLRKQGTKTKCIILDYIPMGSTMLTRHAHNRIVFYREITDKVKVVK